MTLNTRQEAGGDRRDQLWGSLVAFLVINNIVVASRIYVHARTQYNARKRLYLEDIFVLLSALCVNAVIGCLLASTHRGLGLHSRIINERDPHKPRNLSDAFKFVWIPMVLQAPTFLFIKLSLLFLYRRLFLVHQKWLRIAWWANIVYAGLWAFGSMSFYVFQCWPVQWYWMRYYQRFQSHSGPPFTGTGQCHATTVQHVALPPVFGLVSDVALLFLPLTAILKLQISQKRKLGLAGIFSVGTIACLLELARIVELFVDTDDSTDPSYGVVVFLILTVAEEVTAIICSSLPVVIPFLYQQSKSRQHSPSHSSKRSKFQSSPNLTKLSSLVPPSISFGRGFGKLDEHSDSSIELRSHGAGNIALVSTGGAAEWPFCSNNPSYSMAAATPAKAQNVANAGRDIVVRKEVRITTVNGTESVA